MADHVRRFADNYIASHRESDLYERVGEWLRAQGGPGVSMAYLEVGEVGYYSDSRVIARLPAAATLPQKPPCFAEGSPNIVSI